MNIEFFFPNQTIVQEKTASQREQKHIVFAASKYKKTFQNFLDNGLIDGMTDIPFSKKTLIVLLPQDRDPILSQFLQNDDILGPSLIGEILSREFIQNVQKYVYIVLPFLLPVLIMLTSLKYIFNIVLEMLLILLLFLSSIALTSQQVSISYLLSLVFSMIYAFTIVNYFYYGNFQRRHLFIGLGISLLTTLLSALFLSKSSFMVISDFGVSLSLWLIILMIYFLIRLGATQIQYLQLGWLNKLMQINLSYRPIVLSIVVILAAWIMHFDFVLNLNPISSTQSGKMIEGFENKYTLSQPIMLSIKSDICTFKESECIKQLDKILQDLIVSLPVKSQRIMDIATMYKSFSEEEVDAVNSKKLAQFFLAMEFASNQNDLTNARADIATVLLSISIKTSTKVLSAVMQTIQDINAKYPHFTLSSHNHLMYVKRYEKMFLEETMTGLLIMFGTILTLFFLYYKTIYVVVTFIPSLLTILLFFALHSLLDLDITLMSLVSLILFVGLVSDKIIHIFICYKNEGLSCFDTVYKPILLSDILMIVILFGMVFTGTLLKQFGLELGYLLLVHLFLLRYLLPQMVGKYMKH